MVIDLILGALLWYDYDKDDSDDVFAYQELIHDLDDNDDDDGGDVHDDDDHQELVHDLDDPLQPLLDLFDRSAHLNSKKRVSHLSSIKIVTCSEFEQTLSAEPFWWPAQAGFLAWVLPLLEGPSFLHLWTNSHLSGRCVKL